MLDAGSSHCPGNNYNRSAPVNIPLINPFVDGQRVKVTAGAVHDKSDLRALNATLA